MKFIVVSGSLSGIGKGVIASSIALVVQSEGLNVSIIKIDPYLNIDCGTMSPFEHGECFVLSDGGECDLDLGGYERFLGFDLSKDNNITTGKVYDSVIKKERQGDYLGSTVQVVPHITNEIIDRINKVSKNSQVCVIELGGSVGDIESMPFVEALRQISFDEENYVVHVHVCHVPLIHSTGELKTKPAQISVRQLRSLGIFPDILCVRCEQDVTSDVISKLSNFCQVPRKNIIINKDANYNEEDNEFSVKTIYDVPKLLNNSGLREIIFSKLRINFLHLYGLSKWEKIANSFSQKYPKTINIGIIGKYTGLRDSYLSLTSALRHACARASVNCNIDFIDSETTEMSKDIFSNLDCIVIPGGFGTRGTEGMIDAAKIARENMIPCLGICLGLQIMVIEACRNILKINGATSAEFPTSGQNRHNVVCSMSDFNSENKGGTMRLGALNVDIREGTMTHDIYKETSIRERHRHRYEISPKIASLLENIGKTCTSGFGGVLVEGKSDLRVEIIEFRDHPFYIGCQYHPEYQSYPGSGHPLFNRLIENSFKKDIKKDC